tara:strand:- start:1522 stop:2256 length:735 start_codon:yes stop_codon:yes gene_type:complete
MRYILLIITSTFFSDLFAQEIKQRAFSVNYDYQIPYGDLSEIYGVSSSIGISYFLESKKNILFGADVEYIFGSNVKDSLILESISTDEGYIIDANGYFANINLMQSGFSSYIYTGYAIHKNKNNLSGLYLSLGLGYLQNKIFIDTKNQDIPYLSDEYKRGYDQFTNGISSRICAEYKYYSKRNKNLQFSLGINYTTAYTSMRRPYLFNEELYNSRENKLDKILGIRIGVIIPIKKKNEEKFYYY